MNFISDFIFDHKEESYEEWYETMEEQEGEGYEEPFIAPRKGDYDF